MPSAANHDECDPRELIELFDAVCTLEPSQRAGYLDSHCKGRSQLRIRVEALLRADVQAESESVWSLPALFTEAKYLAAEDLPPFDRLGPYRILSRIGSGGMSSVYLAERDYDGVIGRVAIKVIPRILLDENKVGRFLQERQILARLSHPNIAQMLDAGTTAEGVPWLAMEYVDGVTIDRYVVEQQLGVKARIELLEQICKAVASAHRNLVVHRDLKPANILVTREGVVKLLDFGIARMLDESSTEGSTFASVMTPGYASPEQIAGRPITTSSDVYSLGVVLYELITDEKFSMPRRRLKGDLENTVSMALRVEPERRYASAVDLAEDARRAVEGFPVRARRDSVAYRARKLVARRPLEVGFMALLSIGLLAAGAVAFQQYREAQKRFSDVRAVANSFLFDVDDSLRNLPGTTQARMLIARRGQQYLDALSRDRSSDAQLKRELGTSYRKLGDILGGPYAPNLGDFEGALRDYKRAGDLFANLADTGHADVGLYREWSELSAAETKLFLRLQSTDQSITAADQSVALAEHVVQMQPDSIDAQLALLDDRLFLALTWLAKAHDDGNPATMRHAVEIGAQAYSAASELAARLPGDERVQLSLARACQHEGYALHDSAKLSGDRIGMLRAAALVGQEAELAKRLAKKDPDRYTRILADALSDQSHGLSLTGDGARAEAAARESVGIFEKLAHDDPNNVEALHDLFIAHWSLATALAAEKNDAQAFGEYRKVLSIDRTLREKKSSDQTDAAAIEAADWLAAFDLRHSDRTGAIALYKRNLDLLGDAQAVSAQIALALDYEALGEAQRNSDLSQSQVYFQKASDLWDKLRGSNRVPPVYVGKPDELRRKTALLVHARLP